MDRPGTRVDRLIEYVAVLRAFFAGGPVNHHGEHYRISELTCSPPAFAEGGPPFLIGGGAPRMLRFAGSNADIVGVNPSIHSGEIDVEAAADGLPDRIDAKFGWVREGAGDRYDQIEFNAWLAVAEITDDAPGLAELLAPAFGADPEAMLDAPVVLVGTVDEVADRLIERRDRWGFSYTVIPSAAAEAFAPVVARLTGT